MFNFLFCLIFGFSSSVPYNVQNFELFEQKIFQFQFPKAHPNPLRLVKTNQDAHSAQLFPPSYPILIGKVLKLSPPFPPDHTVHESFEFTRRSIVLFFYSLTIVRLQRSYLINDSCPFLHLHYKDFIGSNTTFQYQLSSLFFFVCTYTFDTFLCSDNSIFTYILRLSL